MWCCGSVSWLVGYFGHFDGYRPLTDYSAEKPKINRCAMLLVQVVVVAVVDVVVGVDVVVVVGRHWS